MFLIQILAELDRILEKEAVCELREIWKETIPKIFAIARGEVNSYANSLLEEVSSSDGKIAFIASYFS